LTPDAEFILCDKTKLDCHHVVLKKYTDIFWDNLEEAEKILLLYPEHVIIILMQIMYTNYDNYFETCYVNLTILHEWILLCDLSTCLKTTTVTNAVKEFLLVETSKLITPIGLELKLTYFNCFAILQGIYNIQMFFISSKTTSESFNNEINTFLEMNDLKYINNYFKYPDLNDLLVMFKSNILPHLLEYIIFKLRGFKHEDTKYTILFTRTQIQIQTSVQIIPSLSIPQPEYDYGYKHQEIYKSDLETFILTIKNNQLTNNEAIEFILLLTSISKIKYNYPIENEVYNLLYLLLISNSYEYVNKTLLNEILNRVFKHYRIINKFKLPIFNSTVINTDNVYDFITSLKLLITTQVQTEVNMFYTNDFKKIYEKEIQIECVNRVINTLIILFRYYTLLSQRLIKVFAINNLNLVDLDVINTFITSDKKIKDYEAFVKILIKLGLSGNLDELKLQFSDIKILRNYIARQ